ncbi:MAG: FCD domain-containing protein, partial [Telluria sp.]
LASFTRLDMEFHRRMYEAAAVPDLWSMMRSRSGNLDRLRRLHLPLNGKARAILDQHEQIVRSIERGDPVAAQRMVRDHLSGTLNAIDALRARYPDLLLPADYAAPAA